MHHLIKRAAKPSSTNLRMQSQLETSWLGTSTSNFRL